MALPVECAEGDLVRSTAIHPGNGQAGMLCLPVNGHHPSAMAIEQQLDAVDATLEWRWISGGASRFVGTEHMCNGGSCSRGFRCFIGDVVASRRLLRQNGTREYACNNQYAAKQ